jgi:DedD protein
VPKPVPAAKPAPAAPSTTPTPAPRDVFQQDDKGLPVAWVIQVASLSSADAAEQLKKSLQDKGFKAYTQVVKAGSGQAVRVYVGPKLSREQADAQKREIDRAFKVNALVTRFQP